MRWLLLNLHQGIVYGMWNQQHKFYHLGVKDANKSTLSRVNDTEPYTLYEAMFGKLLKRCQANAPQNKFKFKKKLCLLDTTIIDLCLEVFPWAHFRTTKGAVKIHTGLDADGYLPTFIDMTDGKTHEINRTKTLKLPKGAFVADRVDRGFTDYNGIRPLLM